MVAQNAILSQDNCVTFANLVMLSVQIKKHAHAVLRIVRHATLAMEKFVLPAKVVIMQSIMIIVKP